jgi:hypothetical protein
MSAVNVATFKAHAEEFVAKAIAGQVTVIEQNGKRAILLPCAEGEPDAELYPEINSLLADRVQSEGAEPTREDWSKLRERINRK